MSLVQNMPPLQFHESQITQQEITDTYLENALLLYPEIKKNMIRAVCEENDLPLLQRVVGFGRTVTEKDIKGTEKMSIAAERIQWTVQPWLRNLFCLCQAPVGNGAAGSDITLGLDQNWGAPGMILMFQDGHGNFLNVRLNTFATAEGGSGCFQYTGQLFTSDPTLTLSAAFIQEGQCVGWTWDVSADCDDSATKMPFRTPAWLENYTTTAMTFDNICTTGIQSVLWIEGVNGSRCFQPWQEFQMFQNFLKSFEMWMWYSTKTVNYNNGTIYNTNEQGNQIRAGSGFFEQVDSTGYINSYNISVTGGIAGYNNPANYDALLTYLQNSIIDWSVQQGLTKGANLDVYCGVQIYALLNRALKGFADESGGCCFIYDYEEREEYEIKNKKEGYSYGVGYEFKQYNFFGFNLTLRQCGVFSSPDVQGFTVPGQTTPWEAWKFVIMPDLTCDGTPLLQYYSRAGCGTSNAFEHGYIAGTVDPMAPNAGFVRSTNMKKGYTVWYLREGVLILNDPGKCLVFKPVPVA